MLSMGPVHITLNQQIQKVSWAKIQYCAWDWHIFLTDEDTCLQDTTRFPNSNVSVIVASC